MQDFEWEFSDIVIKHSIKSLLQNIAICTRGVYIFVGLMQLFTLHILEFDETFSVLIFNRYGQSFNGNIDIYIHRPQPNLA